MFEQSTLLDGPIIKKSGAFFASLSAQIGVLGVLLLMPLLYTETLPIRTNLPAPLSFSQPPAPPAQKVTARPETARSSPSHRVFAPTRILLPDAAPAEPLLLEPGAPLTSSGADAIALPFAGTILPLERIPRPAPQHPTAAAPMPQTPQEPLRVSEGVQAAKLIKRVVPAYPPLARLARISGTVRLMGVIEKNGAIERLQVLSGHPLLQNAALDAVRQWIYQPTFLNGEPVAVIAPIDVIFLLQ